MRMEVEEVEEVEEKVVEEKVLAVKEVLGVVMRGK
jgi:hypothetical protein